MRKIILSSLFVSLCFFMLPISAGAEHSREGQNGQEAFSDTIYSATPSNSAAEGEGLMQGQAGNGNKDDRFYDEPRPGPEALIAGFAMLVDLSSSMCNMAPCGGRIKEEAVAALLRRINHYIPDNPYMASLRVFGYKQAWSHDDFTILYYGPTTYSSAELEAAIARLAAADSMSPFAAAIDASEEELKSMGNPKAVLMFSDFEPVIGSGDPVQSAARVRRHYGADVAVYTFYVSNHADVPKRAEDVAEAGGGKAYDICHLLEDKAAFESMMMDIFGLGNNPCSDDDGDGVCDTDDLCPNTPRGAPVDGRGCWIAAYSQFFDFDKDQVKNAYLKRIKRAAEVLERNPELRPIMIEGHTDNAGSPDYNMDLGRRRAEAVKALLVEYGVSPDRLMVKSYGETQAITTNDTEEGRARNRRVELHIGENPRSGYQE